ncbi:MAG: alpha/beta hydrolase [Edaphobacter sp.]|uniref:alpha/beta fold hydrolase n=1 Tax=Edaphobacter sp. TaxID=1934404 RepID=UPI00238FE03B|nr:alpha/beta hydrolase [Edaphobacter sp.]MDE1178483.1 alpha/beta hydrolase [Edaphobacter sp.]
MILRWMMFVFATAALSACAQTGVYRAGSRNLYIHCEGVRHGAAVVLEAGAWRDSTDWSKVQPEVARFTQVCSYDREGLGKSKVDGVSNPDAVGLDEGVEELHLLLLSAGVKPPYILMGHSAGGIKVRRYARDHPAEVVGMVLVDSAHEEQEWRFKAIDPSSVQIPEQVRENARRAGLPTEPGERLVWHDDIPLIVLEHGIPFHFEGNMAKHAAEFEATMHEMQLDLASRSSKGELRTAKKSGHDIMLDEPEFVTTAIRDVWNAAR